MMVSRVSGEWMFNMYSMFISMRRFWRQMVENDCTMVGMNLMHQTEHLK